MDLKYPIIACLIFFLNACGLQQVAYPLMSPLELTGEYGYHEQALEKNQYRVSYTTPQITVALTKEEQKQDVERSRSLGEDFAYWRAAQLTIAEGFLAFRILETTRHIDTKTYDETHYSAGHLYEYGPSRYSHRNRFPYYFDHRQPYMYRSVRVSLTIELVVEFVSENAINAIDAKTFDEKMRLKHPQAYAGKSG